MKRLLSLFLIFSLVSTQLIAYSPSGFQAEVDQGIQIFESNEISINNLKNEKISLEKFKKVKAKMISTYTKEYKKASRKSESKQLKRALRKLKNRFKLMRRKSKNISKKQIARIARIKKSTPQEVKESLTNTFSKESEIRTKEQLEQKIEEHGSYANFLKASIDEISQLTHADVATFSTKKDANRKPASMFFDELGFALFFFLIIIPVALVALVIIGLIMIFAGGAGIVVMILTGAVTVAAVIYIIAVSEFTLW
ncbi:hypothetical protein N9N67_03280 [Bacteriovoracaceae bacterium]|nr:hypothetical protein [Bacteriovoracaceae bacterium]